MTGDRVMVRSPTEERNPRSAEIDRVSIPALLELINDEDARVADAVRATVPGLAGLVQSAVERIGAGGRVHYFGAGTSGRLGMLDSAELPPTFGVQRGLFVAHLAGGEAAMRDAVEGAEDDAAQGAREAAAITGADVVIGLAASGRTPYVVGALRYAAERGAVTALVTSNPSAELVAEVQFPICVATGPEVITGSTRMKSATAQKLVLNMFSTAVMIRLGRTWSNLMTSVTPTNAKLRGRVVRLLGEATGLDERACERTLAAADGQLPVALVMVLGETDAARAHAVLAQSGGVVARALATLRACERPAG